LTRAFPFHYPESPMREFVNTAIEAARKAGELQLQGLRKKHKIDYKGEINLVTEVDRQCEELILGLIGRRFPDHDILTEETPQLFKGSPYRWIVDPLDGTTNYVHGYPVFCVSIALEYMGEIVLGVVYDPTREELFVGQKGGGAFLNGEKIRVSQTRELSKGLLVTGFPYDLKEDPVNNLDHFTNMIMEAQAVRRDGSAALNLCYVASGRFDGFWELKFWPWDVAAGALIVKEAGGKVTDFDGRNFDPYGMEIVASNGLIHESILKVLRKGRRPTIESRRFPM